MNIVITKDTKIKKYLMKSYQKIKNPKTNLESILNLYEKYKDDKLKKFMSKFLKDFEKVCEIFDLFIVQLVEDIGIYNFRGSSFIYIFDD